jgi:hypothetical protein
MTSTAVIGFTSPGTLTKFTRIRKTRYLSFTHVLWAETLALNTGIEIHRLLAKVAYVIRIAKGVVHITRCCTFGHTTLCAVFAFVEIKGENVGIGVTSA